MALCSCAEMSRPEMREALALGVAGVQEMSIALGLDCVSCHGSAPVDEAPRRRAKDAPPLAAYRWIGLLLPMHLRRN